MASDLPPPELRQDLTPGEVADVQALAAAATAADDRQALDDLQVVALHEGLRAAGSMAVVQRSADGELVAYAQASPSHDGWSADLVRHPDHRDAADDPRPAVLAALLDGLRGHGARGTLHWWVGAATDADAALAETAGFTPGRTLHQMRVDLPLAEQTDVPTRSFVLGQDEEAWVAVNNRAFAGHPEQGGWDVATVQAREQEPWFDPEGFRVHEVDGRVVGFCWTKLHHDHDPVLGEIYVIAVDPTAGGKGLGRAMVLAGLQSIAERGVRLGVLFVDADNPPAMRLYTSLGFHVHRTDRAFTATL